MSDKKVLVYINLKGKDEFVGTLWSHFYRGKETSNFEYSRDWLKNSKAFSLEPGLFLGAGKQVNPRKTSLFGSFSDSTPDTWGRILMRKYEAQLARENSRSPKTLNEIDYLLYVNDYALQGALRFKTEGNGQFLWPGDLYQFQFANTCWIASKIDSNFCFKAPTSCFKWLQKCSIGFKSGEYGG